MGSGSSSAPDMAGSHGASYGKFGPALTSTAVEAANAADYGPPVTIRAVSY
jgi:hypothetical protein